MPKYYYKEYFDYRIILFLEKNERNYDYFYSNQYFYFTYFNLNLISISASTCSEETRVGQKEGTGKG